MTRYAQRTLQQQPTLSNWGKAAPTGIGVVDGYGVATGGSATSVTVSGVNYTLLTFTADSNLVVSTAGLFDVMLIGGGGGGGNRDAIDTVNSGGGGAGGVAVATVYLAATTYAVDVGAGGAAQTRGSDSTLGSVTVGSTVAPTAVGGGAGTGFNPAGTVIGFGGSGGGRRNDNTTAMAGVLGQGNASGVGVALGNGNGAAGGGGASAVGGNGTSSVGGAGGAGLDVSSFIGGSALYKAGGGGGQRNTGSGGAGGSSVGGAGASSNTTGGTAAANTGSGGGGGDGGGAGGSGIVYVRFKV